VIIQAGVSASGQAFAAAVADIVFTVETSLETAQSFYAAAQHRVAAAGRPAGSMKIMPGLLPILGRTAAAAAARDRELQALVPTGLAVSYLSDVVQHDLSRYSIDGPLPDLPETNGERGRLHMIMQQARGEVGTPSIRSLAVQMVQNRGHRRVIGTAVEVADVMQRWFDSGACDGFNILAPFHPGGLAEFVDGVVPELQRRGIFRSQYNGLTLREHLNLSRPGNVALRH
jgi:alkanesulfonate monooxygenase SsuD/methylene tetrahydromethanopterin reductase-like flavin-dependent oxidoreductase (luciferase family)